MVFGEEFTLTTFVRWLLNIFRVRHGLDAEILHPRTAYLLNRCPLLLCKFIVHQLQTAEVLVAAIDRLTENALTDVLISGFGNDLAGNRFV